MFQLMMNPLPWKAGTSATAMAVFLAIMLICSFSTPPRGWTLDYSYEDGFESFSLLVSADGNVWAQRFIGEDTSVYQGKCSEVNELGSRIQCLQELENKSYHRPSDHRYSDIAIRRLVLHYPPMKAPISFDLQTNEVPSCLQGVEELLWRLGDDFETMNKIDTIIWFQSQFINRAATIPRVPYP